MGGAQLTLLLSAVRTSGALSAASPSSSRRLAANCFRDFLVGLGGPDRATYPRRAAHAGSCRLSGQTLVVVFAEGNCKSHRTKHSSAHLEKYRL